MLAFLREFALFLRARKKYWLLPIVLTMALVGGLLVLTSGSVIGPYIYTMF